MGKRQLTLLMSSLQGSKLLLQLQKKARCLTSAYSMDELKFQLLCGRVPEILPIAYITALADGLPLGPAWIRADPIHFTIDLAHVYHLDYQPLLLEQHEIVELSQLLGPLFAEFNLTLKTPTKKRWYLQCEKIPDIKTFSPAEFLGKSITDYLPQGNERHFWLRLFTEIQMLLQNSQVNIKRRALGKATIDALWFWGQGQCELSLNDLLPYDQIITDDPVLLGLAQLFKLRYSEKCLEFFQSECWQNRSFQGHYLVCCSSIADEVFEKSFTSRNRGLFTQKMTRLWLYPGDKHCYYVRKLK